jgi:hypothetical protein
MGTLYVRWIEDELNRTLVNLKRFYHVRGGSISTVILFFFCIKYKSTIYAESRIIVFTSE